MDSVAQFVEQWCSLHPEAKFLLQSFMRPIAITAKPSVVNLSPPRPSKEPWTN
jgi:hypothetical protein